jgi:lysozyme
MSVVKVLVSNLSIQILQINLAHTIMLVRKWRKVMRMFCCIFFVAGLSLTFCNAASGQTSPSEFREPWKDPTKAIVLDAYSENDIDCSVLAKEPRVAGIIHKASEGLTHDTMYAATKSECKRLGYKWGSFHVGKSGDPVAQADFYLAKAQPTDDEVIALDLEDITKPQYMKLAGARRFIQRIKMKTGRYPLLYVTGSIREAILANYGADSEFAKTPLWYVRIKKDISQFFPANPLWSSYTLWQFASELNCCYPRGRRRVCTTQPPPSCPLPAPIPSTRFDMDVNIYYGTVEQLRNNWPFTFR